MSQDRPKLTPLQEKLRKHALAKVEEERQAMLAPVFALLNGRGAYVRYEANPVLIRSFWDSIVDLHPKAYSNPAVKDLAHQDIGGFDRETVQTALETLVRDHGLDGPVQVHFPRQIQSQSMHLDFVSHWFGVITCDLDHVAPVIAAIWADGLEILKWDGVVIAAINRRWAIWLDNGELTLKAVQ